MEQVLGVQEILTEIQIHGNHSSANQATTRLTKRMDYITSNYGNLQALALEEN